MANTEQHAMSRWGVAGQDGFQPVPHSLFKHQAGLDLSNSELVTLLNILDFWWLSDRLPFPGVAMLAKRMGVSDRSVQRAVEKLENKGLIKRSSVDLPSGEQRRGFDVGGLIARLEELSKLPQSS